jgi:putative endonuclease
MDKATFVYMLRCADGSFYVGSHRGTDVRNRVDSHNAGLDPSAYTYRRRPVTLIWSEVFEDAVSAIFIERRIKGWSRAKIAPVNGDWEEIQRLARSPNYRPPRDPFASS